MSDMPADPVPIDEEVMLSLWARLSEDCPNLDRHAEWCIERGIDPYALTAFSMALYMRFEQLEPRSAVLYGFQIGVLIGEGVAENAEEAEK